MRHDHTGGLGDPVHGSGQIGRVTQTEGRFRIVGGNGAGVDLADRLPDFAEACLGRHPRLVVSHDFRRIEAQRAVCLRIALVQDLRIDILADVSAGFIAADPVGFGRLKALLRHNALDVRTAGGVRRFHGVGHGGDIPAIALGIDFDGKADLAGKVGEEPAVHGTAQRGIEPELRVVERAQLAIR